MSELYAELEQRQAENRDRFAELAQRLADGKTVAPDDALAVLTAVGKSPADLKGEVDRRKRIAELKTLIAAAPNYQVQMTDLHRERAAAIDVERAEQAELAAKHSLADTTFRGTLTTLEFHARETTQLREELRRLENPPPPPKPMPPSPAGDGFPFSYTPGESIRDDGCR